MRLGAEEPYEGILQVRVCGGCALEAHGIQ